jgi:hypothetical protein
MDIITSLGKWLLTTLRGSDTGDASGNLYILKTDSDGRLEVTPQPVTVTLQGYDYDAATARAVAVDADGILQVNTQALPPLFFPALIARDSSATYYYNASGAVELPAGVRATTAYTLHIPAGYTSVTPVFSVPFSASGDLVLSFYVSYGAVGGSDTFTVLDSEEDEVITVTAATVMAGTAIDISTLPANKITTLLSVREGDDASDTVATGINFLGWWLA